MKQLEVDLGERTYPIYIGSGLQKQAADYLQKHNIGSDSPVMVISDSNIAPLYLEKLEQSLSRAGYRVFSAVVPAGEKSKSLAMLDELVEKALTSGLDRHSTILALGGGVVGDLAGFVAASFMRGIRFIQLPTTILAHDSSVGGKVAVNHRLAKNIIGAFHQPEMVLYDLDTLQTLPKREVRAGLSEVIKHGLIWDEAFAIWCEEHAEELLGLDSQALEYALYMGCSIKAKVVSEDERELGLRAILNLGHTTGHAIEAVAKYDQFVHGEAISIGMAAAAKLAQNYGGGEQLYETTVRMLSRFGLPTALPLDIDINALMQAMMHDKKFKGGSMTFIIPKQIGKVEIRSDIQPEHVKHALEYIRRGE